MARRPELERRSVRVESWSPSPFEKNRFAAVLITSSLSPTDTIAEASTRTLMGRGVPSPSRSAVWSVMSRSTLMTLLEIVVPVVRRGISLDLPGPRYMIVPPLSQLTSRMVPASTSRRKAATMRGMKTRVPTRTAPTMRPVDIRSMGWCSLRSCSEGASGDDAPVVLRIDLFDPDPLPGADLHAGRALFGEEDAEQLPDLAIHREADHPLPGRVEAAHRLGLLVDGALD